MLYIFFFSFSCCRLLRGQQDDGELSSQLSSYVPILFTQYFDENSVTVQILMYVAVYC